MSCSRYYIIYRQLSYSNHTVTRIIRYISFIYHVFHDNVGFNKHFLEKLG